MSGTLNDVAKLAGVSRSTASRVLSNRGYASADTRARVLEAARTTGYRRNGVARSLRLQQTRAIGLLVEDVQNSFYAQIARGVEQAARQRDYQTVLTNTDDDAAQEQACLELLEETRVEGVVASPSGRTDRRAYEQLMSRGVALVQVDIAIPGLTADRVIVDNEGAARLAVQHLIDHGHRRIGALASQTDLATMQLRLSGYRAVLAENDVELDEELLRPAVDRGADEHRAARELLSLPTPPTAVFTASNSAAAALVLTLSELGLRCPEDVSIVSFDDSPWMSFFPTPISAVHQPTVYMAQTAVNLLLDRLNDRGTDAPVEMQLAAQLIERASVRKPPRSGGD